MRCVTVRIRSVVWFVTGAVVATVVAVMFVHTWRVDAATDGESAFVPVTPCRILDTRQPGSTAFGPGETRTLDVHGTNGACTLPNDAVGVSMNVTALGATQVGTYLTIWPDRVAQPNASSLNPSPGQPPIPNAVTTPVSAAGRFKVFNFSGSVHVIVDVNGYYTSATMQDMDRRLADLAAANSALQGRVQSLEAKLSSVSTKKVDGKPTVLFTGVNVQVVDGTEDTRCSADGFEDCNGLGNLIVGYNETSSSGADRTGSHNLVVGTLNEWLSHSGIVAGASNRISGEWASVTGGLGSTASGDFASVSGGGRNNASGDSSSVSGGTHNTASGDDAWVSGGYFNHASGDSSSVSGGNNGDATAESASVSGGVGNTASGHSSSVSGGSFNTASVFTSSVSGGDGNTASGSSSSVSGGDSNTASGKNSSVSGGLDNTAEGDQSSILGGQNNITKEIEAAITGGYGNTASGNNAVVSGGENRSATGPNDWRAGTIFEDD